MTSRMVVLTVAWLGVLAAAAWLRLDDLAVRPFHCDEATGARLVAKRMETGRPQFDPTHFHGPIQCLLAEPLCRALGEERWADFSKGTLRLLPAVFGILTVAVPLLGRRRWGDGAMLLAGALLAVAPLLVYYSRMFIHETLLGWAGLLAVVGLLAFPRWGLPGLFLALMFAAKESFIITVIAMICAGVALAVWQWRDWDRTDAAAWVARHRRPALVSLAVFLVVTAGIYSDGFRHWQGVREAAETFFVYQTGAGHDQPFHHYLLLLLWPVRSAGMWWFGTPVAALAAVAVVRTLLPGGMDRATRLVVRYLALLAGAHFVGYGLIAYKTPWLMVLPWILVCVLAGFSVAGWSPGRWRWSGWVMAACVALTLVSQVRQARFATGRLAADPRNPFAYVPTRANIEGVEVWLGQLRAVAPGRSIVPIGVVGHGYWPLPWYLRKFEPVGYWQADGVPPGVKDFPVVFVMPE
ncbi:MAG: TIGR03663 family protein, partial [Akkermansiaceae bacterium]|nr:TIGR03663 family protein [Akkermansiaceae bacterium]